MKLRATRRWWLLQASSFAGCVGCSLAAGFDPGYQWVWAIFAWVFLFQIGNHTIMFLDGDDEHE